jgi:CBS domain-containing protein
MPTAGEFCNRRVVIAKKGETILEVARRMRDEHVGSVVVVDHQADVEANMVPVGILTDRDIVVRVLANTDRHVHSLRVGELMTQKPILVWEDEDLADALKRMRSFGIRRMPVVDRSGILQGIITLDDVLEFLQEQVADMSILLSHEKQRETPHP